MKESLIGPNISDMGAIEIERQIKHPATMSAPALWDAGIPMALAALIVSEIHCSQWPALAPLATGRAGRFKALGLGDAQARALSEAIGAMQVFYPGEKIAG